MTFHIPQAYIYLLTTYKRQPIKALKAIIHNNNTFAMATAEGAKRCSQRPPPRVSCGQAGSFCQHQSFEAPQLKASLLNLVMPRALGLTRTFLTWPWAPQVVGGGSTEVLQPQRMLWEHCAGDTWFPCQTFPLCHVLTTGNIHGFFTENKDFAIDTI